MPGVAVAVVKDDRVVFVGGFGVRTQGQPGAVDANTAFQLASVTKTFTAAALGTLVDQDKLGWDDPVINHLPGFAMRDPYATLHTTRCITSCQRRTAADWLLLLTVARTVVRVWR